MLSNSRSWSKGVLSPLVLSLTLRKSFDEYTFSFDLNSILWMSSKIDASWVRPSNDDELLHPSGGEEEKEKGMLHCMSFYPTFILSMSFYPTFISWSGNTSTFVPRVSLALKRARQRLQRDYSRRIRGAFPGNTTRTCGPPGALCLRLRDYQAEFCSYLVSVFK